MFNILCVDDSENNLFTLSSILEKLDNVALSFAMSAQEGLSILLTQNIDLILLDVQMPEMDGFEAAKLIKANKKTTNIPIIFLTAVFHSKEFQQKGFKVGAIEYLTKPIDDNQLLNKISLYQRLISSEKELYEQKQYMQKIIDLQEQILIVIDDRIMISANQRFFDFFGYQDLNAFHQEFQCVCQLFIDKDDFLPSNYSLIEGSRPWLDTVLEEPDKVHLAIVKQKNSDVILMVKATKIDANKELYVVTLSDVTQMHNTQEQLRHKALTDQLTGAFNRTKFDATIDTAIINSNFQTFTLAMLDIDYFKVINDNYGHLQGDIVLKELVLLLEDNIRNTDILARWGGEEFVLILFASVDKVREQIEKLRSIVANYNFTGMDKTITISIGVGEYVKGVAKDDFIKQVDETLYEAKNSGRNCIREVYST